MNILLTSLTYKPHLGGIENSLFWLARELSKMDNKVFIIVGDKGLREGNNLPKYENIDGIDVYRFKRINSQNIFSKLIRNVYDTYSSYSLVKKLDKKKQFSLAIHRSVFPGLGATISLSKSKNIYIPPAVHHLQDSVRSDPILTNRKFQFNFKYLIQKYYFLAQTKLAQKVLLTVVDTIFVFSNNMKDQVKKNFPKVKKNIKIVNPGVDCNHFKPSLDKASLKKKMGFSSRDFIFLIVARIVGVKGIHHSINAISQLDNKNIKLLIVGDGPKKHQLKMLINYHKLNDKVSLLPYTYDPIKYYQVADIFLMPSTYEPFGQTIIEAMAVGLPVIGFKYHSDFVLTATEEVVKNGTNGFLCDYSENNLAEAMIVALNLSEKKLRLINEDNRKKMIKNYSWINCSKSLLNNGL